MISEKVFTVSVGIELSEIFNDHFLNITKTLDLKPDIISTTTSLPEIIGAFQDNPALNFFFVREGVSVQVPFCKQKRGLERLF